MTLRPSPRKFKKAEGLRSTLFARLLTLLVATMGLTVMAQTNLESRPLVADVPAAPALKVPSSRAEWEVNRRQIRSRLWELLGQLPARPAVPKVHILSREDRNTYVVEKFEFDNGAGATVPGYFLLPKNRNGKVPGILFCHWHGGEYDIGKEELFQARHTPEPPGPRLTESGFAVLGIDAYCFGERNGKGPAGATEKGGDGEMSASKYDLWLGRTLWGMILRDDLMALDYLASRPEVDADRLGVTGISMGATRSWWLMALDERIKSGVAVACLTRYQNLIQHHALKAHGIYYFVPNLLRFFDTEAVIALIAPRPVLFMTGDQDSGSPADGIVDIETAVRPVYQLYGNEGSFQNEIYKGLGHVYTPEMWAKTQAWMEKHLKRPAK
jgi:dienelactone hydrolase